MLVNLVLFFFVLGVLIFFHEMGHFIAAKLCGIYCDRFSLGMPPRVWGIKIGETDYCIGALPIGGFVKMAGQEDAPMTEEERTEEYGEVPPDRWFCNKPVWQRFIVVVAGPLMNLVLAVLLYAIVAALGADMPESELSSRIGEIAPDSPAAAASLFDMAGGFDAVDFAGEPDAVGWKTGDRIVAINGKAIENFTQVRMSAALGSGKVATIEIERTDLDGATRHFASRIEPKVFGDVSHARFGITAFETALVKFTIEDTPAQASGLRAGDVILAAKGQFADRFTLTEQVLNAEAGEALDLLVEREGARLSLTMTPERVGRFRGVYFDPPLRLLDALDGNKPLTIVRAFGGVKDSPLFEANDVVVQLYGRPATASLVRSMASSDWDEEMRVAVKRGEDTIELRCVFPEFIAALTGFDIQQQPRIAGLTAASKEATGLKPNDVITMIDSEPATAALLKRIERDRVGQSIPITVHRPAVRLFGFFTMRDEETLEASLDVSAVGALGILWDTKLVFHREPPMRVFPAAFGKMKNALSVTMQTIGALIEGRLSSNDLGGPVMIHDIVTRAAQAGYNWLLTITAFISVNLCVFNLLPLPVLDGGLVVFLAIEGVRRKPLSMKVQETVQKFGFVFIIGLILFVTYNDIHRKIMEMLP